MFDFNMSPPWPWRCVCVMSAMHTADYLLSRCPASARIHNLRCPGIGPGSAASAASTSGSWEPLRKNESSRVTRHTGRQRKVIWKMSNNNNYKGNNKTAIMIQVSALVNVFYIPVGILICSVWQPICMCVYWYTLLCPDVVVVITVVNVVVMMTMFVAVDVAVVVVVLSPSWHPAFHIWTGSKLLESMREPAG